MTEDDALGTVHRMGIAWALLWYRHRTVPIDGVCHASVRHRKDAKPAYGRRIPASVTWADEAWLTPYDGANPD